MYVLGHAHAVNFNQNVFYPHRGFISEIDAFKGWSVGGKCIQIYEGELKILVL